MRRERGPPTAARSGDMARDTLARDWRLAAARARDTATVASASPKGRGGGAGEQYRRAETVWGLEREKLVADEAALKARIQQLEEDMAAQVAPPCPPPPPRPRHAAEHFCRLCEARAAARGPEHPAPWRAAGPARRPAWRASRPG